MSTVLFAAQHKIATFKERFRRAASQKAIYFACCLPQCMRGPIASLQSYGRSRLDKESTALPSGVRLRLLDVYYADLVFVEEFPRLLEGLLHLRKVYGSPRDYHSEGDLSAWFDKARARTGGSATLNAGTLDLARARGSEAPNAMVDSVHIYLLHIAPSVVCVCMCARPGACLDSRLQKLLARDSATETVIERFNLREGVTKARLLSPADIKRERLDKLFLDIQEEMARLQRCYTASSDGQVSFPASVEVFVVDREASGGTDQETCANSAAREERWFWDALEMMPNDVLAYTDEWAKLFPPDAFQDRRRGRWRALLDAQSFAATESLDGFTNQRSAMSYMASEALRSLAALVAVQQHARAVVDKAAALRQGLAPLLAGTQSRPSFKGGFAGALRLMMSAANIQFVVSRLMAEMDEEHAKHLSRAVGLDGFMTAQRGDWPPSSVVDDLLSQIKHEHGFSNSQIELMKRSYDALLGYETIRSTDRLQRSMLFFTILLVALTCALVPAETRVAVVKWVCSVGPFSSK